MQMKRKKNSKVVSTKITDDDFNKLQTYAADRGISLYEATRQLLLYGLRVNEKESSGDVSMLEELKAAVKGTEDGIVKYLQQILYHGFRTDMWNIQYAKKVHKNSFAQELDQEVEDLAKKHSA